jgi:hypothetical protein
MEVEERGDLESNREVKQKLPLSNDVTAAIETKEGCDTNQVNVGNTSLKASKLKNEKISVDNNSNETKLMEESVDKKSSSEANRLISTRQKVSLCTDKEEIMPTKVKVADKYKVNVNTSWEVSAEVGIFSPTIHYYMNIICNFSSFSGSCTNICVRLCASLNLGIRIKFQIKHSS